MLKMEKLLNDHRLVKNLGENGYENVKSNFSAETISNEWLKFYNRILNFIYSMIVCLLLYVKFSVVRRMFIYWNVWTYNIIDFKI